MTREYRDSEGNLLVSITLPDDATEEDWAIALSAYIYIPPTVEETEE